MSMIGKKVEVFVETRTPGGWTEREWKTGTVAKEWSAQENFRSPEWGWEVDLETGETYKIHQMGTNWKLSR